MAALFFYSIKLSVSLGMIYLFYQLVLRNLTFYHWNRWFLLAGTGLSLILPWLGVPQWIGISKAEHLPLVKNLPVFQNFSTVEYSTTLAAGLTLEKSLPYVLALMATGMLVLSIRLLVQFLSLYQIRRNATLLQQGEVTVYHVEKQVAPFCFGKVIYLNKNLLEPAELHEVIRHERVHACQNHTIDVLWIEMLVLVNWYNPFVWLLKRAVRQNLEFIVDNEVLTRPEADKKYYQYLMLKITGLPDLAIANQFNISSLKSRISMMNRNPSNKRNLLKYLFVLPLLAFLLLAFRGISNHLFAENDTETEVLQGNRPATANDDPLTYEAFLKKNPTVSKLESNDEGIFTVRLKTGKVETYDFKDKKASAQFEKKYGKLPPPPPPVVGSVHKPEFKSAGVLWLKNNNKC